MKMLHHLMHKDLQRIAAPVIFTWVCLGIAVLLPFLRQGADMPLPVGFVLALCLLMVPSSMMLVLLRLLHLDHPAGTDGFLQTRPVAPVMRWLPKFALWGILMALPVVLVQPVMLWLHRVDAEAGYLALVVFRASLGVCGVYGVLACVMVWVPRERLAVWLCLPLMFFLLFHQASHTTVLREAVGDAGFWADHDLSASRILMALNMAGLAGFVVAAWRLGRGRLVTLLAGVAGMAALVLACLWFWPMSLLSRYEPEVAAEPARVRELAGQTRVLVSGALRETRSPRSTYCSDAIVVLPPDTLEWAALVDHGPAKPMRLADGTEINGEILLDGRLWNVPDRRLMWQAVNPPNPTTSLIRLLRLPDRLARDLTMSAADMGRYAGPAPMSAAQNLLTDARLPQGSRVSLSGQVSCEWFRPVVLGSVPLESGAHFSQSGMAVQVQNVFMMGDSLHVTMRLNSIYGRSGIPATGVDQHPQFQIVIMHPGRQELALPGARRYERSSASLVTEEVTVEGEYDIVGVNKDLPAPNVFWVQEARLYVVRRVSLGTSQIPYHGELTVENLPSRP